MLAVEPLMTILQLALQYLQCVDNLWALLFLQLQFVDFLHELDDFLLPLLEHLLELANLQLGLGRA